MATYLVKCEAAAPTVNYGAMDRLWYVCSSDTNTDDVRTIGSTDATAVGATETVTARG